MPELPEVEMVVRGLRPDVVGRTFTGADVLWARELVEISPLDFAARLVRQQVKAINRRAKYIVFILSDDYLLVHLKMTGRLYVSRHAEQVQPIGIRPLGKGMHQVIRITHKGKSRLALVQADPTALFTRQTEPEGLSSGLSQ